MPGSFPGIPQTEAPIYIEYVQRGDHYDYDQSNTSASERRPVAGTDCWIDTALIPATPPTPSAYPGTVSGIVTGISGVQLTAVAGNAYRFAYQATPQQFQNMVPANYSGGVYQPLLQDAAGVAIPYNPSVWVADGVLSVVEFKQDTPQALGYLLPLSLTYWQYTGRTAAASIAPPAAVALYVSATGSDTAGAGTQAAPYASLARAYDDIRNGGYQVAATVNILGASFTLPAGVTSLDSGAVGEQQTPVLVQGAPRTVLANCTVAARAVDPTTGFLDLTVAAPPATPFALGQVVHIASGNAFLIANVVSATRIHVAFNNGGFAVGSHFTLEAIATTLNVGTNGATLNGGGSPVVFQNLKIVASGLIALVELYTQMVGVWVQSAPAQFAELYYQNCTFTGGLSTGSALGVFFDGTLGDLAVTGYGASDMAQFANCIFVGAGVEIIDPVYLFLACYFNGISSPILNVPNLVVQNCEFVGLSGFVGIGAPYAALSGISISNSAATSLSIEGGLCQLFDPVTIAGAGGNAISVNAGGVLVLYATPTLTGTTGSNYHVSNRGTLYCVAAGLDASGAGLVVDTGGFVYAPAITASNCAADGVDVLTGGMLVCGALTALANAGASNINVVDGTLVCTGTITSGTGLNGLSVGQGGAVYATGGITATGAQSVGILSTGGRLVVGNHLTATGNGTVGVSLTASDLWLIDAVSHVTVTVTGNCTSSLASQFASVLLNESNLYGSQVTVTVNGSGNGTPGLMAKSSTLYLDLFSTFACNNNGAAGISLTNCTTSINSAGAGVTLSGNGTDGIAVTGGSFWCQAPVSSTGHTAGAGLNNQQGAAVLGSSLAATGNLSGLVCVGGSLTVAATLDCSNTATTTSSCLALTGGARLYVGGAVTANTATIAAASAVTVDASTLVIGSSASPASLAMVGSGSSNASVALSVSRTADVTVFGTLTIANARTNGILVQNNSRFTCTGAVAMTAPGTTGTSISVAQGSYFNAGSSVSATSTAVQPLFNLQVVSGSTAVVAGTLTLNAASTNEIQVQNATLVCTGLVNLTGVTSGGNTTAVAANLMSRVFFGQLVIPNTATKYVTAVSVAGMSQLAILGNGTSVDLSGAGASAADVILLDNSTAQIGAGATSTTLVGAGAASAAVAFTNNSSGRVLNVACNNGGNGVRVVNGSRAELRTVTGTGNSGVGLLIGTGSQVSYLAGTLSVTGTTGNVTVGGQAVTSWANVQTGQLQYVNDWSFANTTGTAFVATFVSQSCSIAPHS